MPNLLFCMTPGVELNTWKQTGSMNRELKPYVEYARTGWKVKLLTFDKASIPELPEGIEAILFPNYRLLWFLPRMHRELGKWADVIKTNQSVHAYLYTRAAKHWKKPILLRCGYVRGEYLQTTLGLTPRVRLYQWFEARAFKQATHCEVPTKELSEWVQGKYRIPEEKISVIPNFVDTELFRPMREVQKIEKSVISVGRLAPIKQFDLLIRACAEIPGCTLTILGEGPERKKLQKLANELKVNLKLPGNIPNEDLPHILNRHKVFAITSKREGHPKALIEAMACGMACVGAKTPGIENVIRHEHNGWLVNPSVGELSRGISCLAENNTVADQLGKKALGFVLERYSFDRCYDLECRVAEQIVREK